MKYSAVDVSPDGLSVVAATSPSDACPYVLMNSPNELVVFERE